MAVISDKKLPEETGTLDSIADYYEPELLSASDYYPFGMQMPGRNYMAEGYRFGFNGKEKDDNNEWGNLTNVDSLLNGENVILEIEDIIIAKKFIEAATRIGVNCRLETK